MTALIHRRESLTEEYLWLSERTFSMSERLAFETMDLVGKTALSSVDELRLDSWKPEQNRRKNFPVSLLDLRHHLYLLLSSACIYTLALPDSQALALGIALPPSWISH